MECSLSAEKYPKLDDIVMVIIDRISDAGYYVLLPEYNNIEGFITFGEISRHNSNYRPRNICNGQQRAAIVLRIDENKKYIDLSIKRVLPHDSDKCFRKYTRAKIVNDIVKQIVEKTNKTMQEFYEKYIWTLTKKYGDPYDAFKLILTEPDTVFDAIGIFDVSERNDVSDLIVQMMKQRNVKAYAEIDLMCFETGIDGIKKILSSGEITNSRPQKFGNCICNVIIQYIGSPTYSLYTISIDRQFALQTLDKSIEIMKQEAIENGGILTIKQQPFIIGENKEINNVDDLENYGSSGDELDEFDDI